MKTARPLRGAREIGGEPGHEPARHAGERDRRLLAVRIFWRSVSSLADAGCNRGPGGGSSSSPSPARRARRRFRSPRPGCRHPAPRASASNQSISASPQRRVPAVEKAADQHVGLRGAAVPGAEAEAFEAVVRSIGSMRQMAGAGNPGGFEWRSCSGRRSIVTPDVMPGRSLRGDACRNDDRAADLVMRPDILNPLFAEVEVLKGIGPALAKPLHRLGLDRVVDIALPSAGRLDRPQAGRDARRGRCRADDHRRADRRATIAQSGRRGPFRDLRRGRGRQLCHAHLFQQSGLGEEAAAARRAADRLGQARPLRPGTADGPSGLCAAARRGRRRSPSASRSIRCPKG